MIHPIYCVQCERIVDAHSVYGMSIYSHRHDLSQHLFYQCPHCGNYVGTHRDKRPLGTIPTPELRTMRHKVHTIIDEYWLPTKDRAKRKALYKALSDFLGKEYHTGTLNSIDECEAVINFYQRTYGH